MSVFNTGNLDKKRETLVDKPLIMLVDDEQENINVLRHLLKSKYKIISGLNGKEALEIIENMVDPQKVQLIISDQRMPELNGVDFFERIVDKMPNTIRILLTGYSDIHTIIDSINKAQIYKFMTKPFEPTELILTIQRGLETFNLRQELIEYAHRLEEMVEERTKELEYALDMLEKASLTDQLTGAYNRRFVHQFIDQEVAQVKRAYFDTENHNHSGKDIGFILIDADHFKSVNDNYGHDAGDEVLIQITQILQNTCRETDWVIRWGGEEFLIICRQTGRDDIQQLAERIRIKIEAHSFNIGNEQHIQRTCSMGLSTYPFTPTDIEFLTWEQTVHIADVALYMAKTGGRNRWVSVFDSSLGTSSPCKKALLNDMETLAKEGKLSIQSSGTSLS